MHAYILEFSKFVDVNVTHGGRNSHYQLVLKIVYVNVTQGEEDCFLFSSSQNVYLNVTHGERRLLRTVNLLKLCM
jgi:hypothetical protein